MRLHPTLLLSLSPLTALLVAGPVAAGVPAPLVGGAPAFSVAAPCTGGVGLPGPNRSIVDLSASATPCQYRFRADGAYPLTLKVTVRDQFDTPVPGARVDVTIAPAAGAVLCSCEPLLKSGFTDAIGAVPVVFSRLGGRGTLDLAVTAEGYCDGVPVGKIAIWGGNVDFTTPDLNGSCEAAASSDVFDLGVWATGLPPAYKKASDYTCDGTVDVFDLGFWAGGLGRGCSP